jgi:hypothetical protein
MIQVRMVDTKEMLKNDEFFVCGRSEACHDAGFG